MDIEEFLTSVDSGGAPGMSGELTIKEERLMGQILKSSQKMTILLSQFDAMMRQRGT